MGAGQRVRPSSATWPRGKGGNWDWRCPAKLAALSFATGSGDSFARSIVTNVPRSEKECGWSLWPNPRPLH